MDGHSTVAANPAGTPIEAFDQIRAAVLSDRSTYWKELAIRSTGSIGPAQKLRVAPRAT